MKRVPELDGIRGLAAILVVLFHLLPGSVFFWGWSAVDLFFVLSGYLITTIIINQREAPGFLFSFYIRRILRIWPVYYFTLLVLIGLNHFTRNEYSTGVFVQNFFFLQNIERYCGHVYDFIYAFKPSWTVAIEEQYYLMWPLMMIALGTRSIPYCSITLIVANVLVRCLAPNAGLILASDGDGLALGCFLAWLMSLEKGCLQKKTTRSIILSFGVLGSVYVLSYLVHFWMRDLQYQGWRVSRVLGFSLLYFGLVGACITCSGHPFLLIFRNPIVRWFGQISYALYLFHMPIYIFVPLLLYRADVHSHAVHFVAALLLIVALPACSWYGFERPILRWKERFLSHTAPHTPPEAPSSDPRLA